MMKPKLLRSRLLPHSFLPHFARTSALLSPRVAHLKNLEQHRLSVSSSVDHQSPGKGKGGELYAVREVWRLFLSMMFRDPSGCS